MENSDYWNTLLVEVAMARDHLWEAEQQVGMLFEDQRMFYILPLQEYIRVLGDHIRRRSMHSTYCVMQQQANLIKLDPGGRLQYDRAFYHVRRAADLWNAVEKGAVMDRGSFANVNVCEALLLASDSDMSLSVELMFFLLGITREEDQTDEQKGALGGAVGWWREKLCQVLDS